MTGQSPEAGTAAPRRETGTAAPRRGGARIDDNGRMHDVTGLLMTGLRAGEVTGRLTPDRPAGVLRAGARG
jgi:hypothetical protein